MHDIIRDIRQSARTLLRQPGFSLIIILAMVLGIGVNSAIYSLVNSVLLRPLPFSDADRIVMVWEDFSAQGGPEQEWIEVPNLFEWRRKSTSFDTLAAFTAGGVNLLQGGEPEMVTAAAVTFDFLKTFGLAPIKGRDLAPQDDQPGAVPVALVSRKLWERRFGGRDSLVGEPININGQPTVVIGILPDVPRLPLLSGAEIWTPLRLDESRASRGNFFLQGVGRLKPDVSLEQADAEMDALMGIIGREFPKDEGVTIQLVPLLEQMVSPLRPALWSLAAATAFVLLIACANVANLMLGRTASRAKEIAVRTALGAGRGRLIRQMLTESVLLSTVGGLLGLVLAYGVVEYLKMSAPPGTPRIEQASLDFTVLIYTLTLSVFAGLLFGIVPAFQTADLNVPKSLKEGRDSGLSRRGLRLRHVLVVGEVALSLFLLIGAGLFVRSFLRLMEVDMGFRAENVSAGGVFLTVDRYPQPAQRTALVEGVLQRLRSDPKVRAASAVSVLPLSGADTDVSFLIEGRPEPQRPQDTPVAWYRQVERDYFATLRIPVLHGRAFEDSDDANGPPAAIISEVTARRYWSDRPPSDVIGERLLLGRRSWLIVGVVQGVRHSALDRAPRPEMYLPLKQTPPRRVQFVARGALDAGDLATALRAELKELDPQMPVSAVTSMSDLVEASTSTSRFFMGLTASFSLLALLLAVLGIYGVMSYNVNRRLSEMGLRMALGAPRRAVLGLILRQGLTWAVMGVGLGLAAALLLTRLYSDLLFEVGATDAVTLVLASLILLASAFIACLVPAYRGTRVDPIEALRYE